MKLLLTFNNNIVNASHEIVKEATKSKVENFFKSVSSSLNFINIKNEDSKYKKTEKEKKGKRKNEDVSTATSILNITADISKTLAMTVDVGSSIDIKLPNISMTVMKRKTGTSNSSVWEADTLKVKVMKSLFWLTFIQVSLPDQPTITGSDSSITVSFTSYDNLGSMLNMDSDFSSSVLSVNVIGVEKVY